MKKQLFSVLAVLFLLFCQVAQPVQASGMKLIMDGNTYYLSTQEDGSVSSRSGQLTTSTTASTSTRSALLLPESLAPRGFSENLGELISFILKIVMVVALLLVLFAFIMGGFEWITSGGDKGKTESARNRIVAAFVGILILSAAFALTQLVAYVLGFNSFVDAINSIRPINTY